MNAKDDVLKFCEHVYERMHGDNSQPFRVGRKYKHTWESEQTIELDDEDIEYLYRKYSKKLREELNSNIDEITEAYNNAINKSEQ